VAAPLAVFEGATAPQGVPPQETVQLTPALLGSLITVAVNCADVPAATVCDCGVTDTDMPETVMFAPLEIAIFATDVAVIITERSEVVGVGEAV
jgi:hypothetical protein